MRPGILPAMRRRAFEIKTVARLQAIFLAIQRDLQIPAQYVNELFAFMSVGISAARFRRDAKQMRLHDRVAPRQQFHAHSCAGFQNLAIRRAHVAAAGSDSHQRNRGYWFCRIAPVCAESRPSRSSANVPAR